MARKNRQKLHRELRLRAEARKRELVGVRKARAAQAAASIGVVAEVLRRSERASTEPACDSAFETFLRNCAVPATVRRRARALLLAAYEHLPAIQPSLRYGMITLLAHQPSNGSLRGAGMVHGDVWRWLAQRALGPWPVPAFLLDALQAPTTEVHRVPWELTWVVQIARTIARGGSVIGMVGTRHLPVPLTRRMVNLFLEAEAGTAPVLALRRAQVAGCGGPDWLGTALAKTFLGQLQGPDAHIGEPWWAQVIAWLSAHPDAAEGDLRGTLDALASLRARSPQEAPFVLKGRTPASLFDLVNAELERLVSRQGAQFPPSGLRPLRRARQNEVEWTFEELRSRSALVDEGTRMRHCVAHYAAMCAQGVTSVWSARSGRSMLTIEVVRPSGCVAQVRGFANRLPTPDETRVVQTWARQNNLEWAA